jgi:DNA-binding response OmpR family regulator
VNKSSILIVDDDPNICFILEKTLSREGYDLDIINDGERAIARIKEKIYDLVLLDLHLGEISGIQVFDSLRESNPDTVVIILTAHGSLESAVKALKLGAFDYLFKPALPETIRQRVKEGLEHHQQTMHRKHLLDQMDRLRQMLLEFEIEENNQSTSLPEKRFIYSGKLIIDRHHHSATLADRLLDLTTTEYNFLLCLVEATPNPVSHRQLVNSSLNYACEEMEAREVTKWHIHRLRQKVEPDPSRPCYIKTVRYQGYMWSGE